MDNFSLKAANAAMIAFTILFCVFSISRVARIKGKSPWSFADIILTAALTPLLAISYYLVEKVFGKPEYLLKAVLMGLAASGVWLFFYYVARRLGLRQ